MTLDAKRFRSRVFGIVFHNAATGESELLAELKDSTGELLAPNQLLYRDAFDGSAAASIRLTYTRAGLEQDIILHENPPLPTGDPALTRLEIWTEFFEAPVPEKRMRILRQTIGLPVLRDEELHFGETKIGRGKAFELDNPGGHSVVVAKEWTSIDNRIFLIESVEYQSLAPWLARLPQAAARNVEDRLLAARKSRSQVVASVAREKPAQTGRVQLARAEAKPRPGVVLDYMIMASSGSNFTFRGDSTFLISGVVSLEGTNTIEGGAILKYTNNATVSFQGEVLFHTSPYSMAVCTSKDDNSIGETINGSTGTPSGHCANRALEFIVATKPIEYIRVSYATTAVALLEYDLPVRHSQFTFCKQGINNDFATSTVRNVLMYRVGTPFYGTNLTVRAEHLTVHECERLTDHGNADSTIYLTNSLLVHMTNSWGTSSHVTNSVAVVNDSAVFQTAGAAIHYLAANSPYRNAGTLGINPTLLTDLRRKTTFPPVLFPSSITVGNTNLIITPQVERDQGLPDLGFSYSPLDMILGAVLFTNSTILITNGAAIGTFVLSPDAYGIGLSDNARLFSEGQPTNLNHIVRYNTVQEQANTTWAAYRGPSIAAVAASVNAQQARFRFTGWSAPARDAAHFYGYAGDVDFAVPFIDCQFHGGSFYTERPQVNVTNCLFERVAITLQGGDHPLDPAFRHCTFVGGTNHLLREAEGTWIFRDNLFDGTGIYTDTVTNNHNNNAYTTNLPRLLPVQVTDVTLVTSNVTYETGPLGRFYLPTNSPTLDMGSTNAANVGLYHFTCTTNQSKEANSTADIGFHYVALNGNNVAVDTDGDYLPDFIEDRDGDAIVDTGEFSWTNSLTFATNGLNDLQIWELSSNVQVNDPAQDTGSNTNTQFETSIVAFGNTVICAWVDSNLGVTGFGTEDPFCHTNWVPPAEAVPRFIGWAVSRDGGVSFSDKGAPPPLTNIVNNTTNVYGDAGDPVLGWDTNANVVYLLGNPKRPSFYYPDGTNQPAKIYMPLWRSTNSGQSFLPPINVLPGLLAGSASDIADKPALAVDNFAGTGQGNVYAAIRWDSNNPTRRIVFNRSDLGGTNWYATNLLVLSDSGMQRPALAVRPNHDVCVLWLDGATNVYFRKSTNLGESFGQPTNIFDLNVPAAVFELKRHTNAAQRDVFNAVVVPALVANPANDDLYVVYHDQATNLNGFPNIYLVQSTNAGTGWWPPIQVNTTNAVPTDQWQPAITVKPDGTKVFIAWYDRRTDTASNSLIQTYGCFADVPISTNSFTNNFLISTSQFPPIHSGTNANANTFDPVYPPIFDPSDPRFCGSFGGFYGAHMGDYDTAVSDNKFVYYSWFDGRNACTNSGVVRKEADIRSVRLSWPP